MIINTVDELINELIQYSMETEIRIVIDENEEPGCHKICQIREIKSENGLHLELEIL